MPSSYTAMQVLIPNGGEIIPSGSTYAITWGAPPNVVKFKLKYSLNNGVTWTAIPEYIDGYSFGLDGACSGEKPNGLQDKGNRLQGRRNREFPGLM